MDEGRIEKARKVLGCAIDVAQDLELAAKILGLTPSGLLRIMTRMEEAGLRDYTEDRAVKRGKFKRLLAEGLESFRIELLRAEPGRVGGEFWWTLTLKLEERGIMVIRAGVDREDDPFSGKTADDIVRRVVYACVLILLREDSDGKD
jgi:DNA-binding MarR family transcriptional regulator